MVALLVSDARYYASVSPTAGYSQVIGRKRANRSVPGRIPPPLVVLGHRRSAAVLSQRRLRQRGVLAVRIDLACLADMLHSLRFLPPGKQGSCNMGVNAGRARLRLTGSKLQRLCEGFLGFDRVAQQEQRPRAVGMKITEYMAIHVTLPFGDFLVLDAAVERIERLLRLDPLAEINLGPRAVSHGAFRPDLDGFIQRPGGVFITALLQQHITQVDHSHTLLRMKLRLGEALAESLLGFLIAT